MIKLLDDKILVEPIKAEETTKAGIHIPTQAKERPNEGTVITVGPGNDDFEMIVKEGDKVIFGKHGGTSVTFEGKDYLVMRQTDIIGILCTSKK